MGLGLGLGEVGGGAPWPTGPRELGEDDVVRSGEREALVRVGVGLGLGLRLGLRLGLAPEPEPEPEPELPNPAGSVDRE